MQILVGFAAQGGHPIVAVQALVERYKGRQVIAFLVQGSLRSHFKLRQFRAFIVHPAPSEGQLGGSGTTAFDYVRLDFGYGVVWMHVKVEKYPGERHEVNLHDITRGRLLR